MKKYCCDDFEPGVKAIDAPIILQAIRSGVLDFYKGKPLLFCPWCGKKIEEEEVRSKVPDVKTMVDRFLGWKLPKGFNPDAGISFKPTKPYEGDEYGNSWWPIGTNLLNAEEAKEMFEYVLREVK